MIVLGLLLNLVYSALVLGMLPIVLWKRLRTGKYRRGWSHKLWGALPRLPQGAAPVVWIHAVSVGEVLQLRQIVDRLRHVRPDLRMLITTTTETGEQVAREKLAGCDVAFFPLDFTWSVRRAFERIQPSLIVLVELELWPNFLREAANRDIPVLLVNGRLSERSHRGYVRIRPLLAPLLNSIRAIAVQTDEYRDRFLSLGAAQHRVTVTGSIKFDGVHTERAHPKTLALADWLEREADAPVVIAGSTQAPEEQMALDAYQTLRSEFPMLRLILVPRHPERGDEVARLIQNAGFAVKRRSRPDATSAGSAVSVGLLDTVGELGACWGLADVAFVGGSFTDRGGQNMLEPAAFGAAVCFGPNTWNFRQVVEQLLARNAAKTVRSQQELNEFLGDMLRNPSAAQAMGDRARTFILQQQGAADRTVALILHALDDGQATESRVRAA